MKADQFFLAAMKAGNYRLKNWVIAAFSLIREAPDAWKSDPYPYRIVHTPAGYFFVTEHAALEPIEYARPRPAGLPPFVNTETLTITPDGESVPNFRTTGNGENTQPVLTNYGNLLFNFIVFIWPLGAKIPYQNQRVSPGDVERLILPRVAENLPEGQGVRAMAENAPIFIEEYKQLVEAAFFCTGFTQLWVPGDTEKSLTPPPGLKEYKAKLYEEYAGRLSDPAAIAEIDAKLIAFDAEYLKGDRSEGFLITGKSKQTVRRKLFLSQGAEMGLDEDVQVDLVPNSLTEGWDISKFPTMNNAQRAGSFNRGAQTELGGQAVKWLLRASSNMQATIDDCGAVLGRPTLLDEEKLKQLSIGFSLVTKDGHEVLTPENAGQYLGKTMMVRSPQFCKLGRSDYCKVCVGPRLALNPLALSSAVTAQGSIFMSIFMKAAHARNLQVAHMKIEEELE